MPSVHVEEFSNRSTRDVAARQHVAQNETFLVHEQHVFSNLLLEHFNIHSATCCWKHVSNNMLPQILPIYIVYEGGFRNKDNLPVADWSIVVNLSRAVKTQLGVEQKESFKALKTPRNYLALDRSSQT